MAKGKDYKQPTRAELQAMRDSKIQGGPVTEAVRRELSFLRNIGGAGDDLEWILFNQAWTELGFENVGDWWEQRVLPVLVNVDVRPSPTLAERVMAAIAADEAGLPRLQRRTQRQIAALAQTNQTKVSRSRRDSNESESDLEKGGGKDVDATDKTAAGAATPPADGASDADTSAPAAGPTDLPAAGPAVTPDHPAAPGDAADNPTAAGTGDETADEEASPSTSDAAAQREQQEPSEGVSEPAAPATGRPVPAYIGKSLALFEAVYDLIQEDSAGVGEIIPDDLAEHVIAATASLAKWVKGMQDSFDGREAT